MNKALVFPLQKSGERFPSTSRFLGLEMFPDLSNSSKICLFCLHSNSSFGGSLHFGVFQIHNSILFFYIEAEILMRVMCIPTYISKILPVLQLHAVQMIVHAPSKIWFCHVVERLYCSYVCIFISCLKQVLFRRESLLLHNGRGSKWHLHKLPCTTTTQLSFTKKNHVFL